MLYYLDIGENQKSKSTFLVQKKPVASGERIIPWNINGGKQLICPATNVHIYSFFPSTEKVKYKLDSLYNKIRNSILNCYSYIGYFFFIAR